MASDHPNRELYLPPDAPFELKPSPGKGWGVFATRAIKKGQVVFAENPVLITPEALELVPPDDIQLRHALEDHLYRCTLPYVNGGEASEAFNGLGQLVTEKDGLNNHQGPHYIINLHNIHSRFNHSCVPNSQVLIERATITRYAVADIAAGEEITWCYNTQHMWLTRDERSAELSFVCFCNGCTLPTHLQEVGDLRRRLMRGLHYLWDGVDWDGQKQTSGRPLILDPILKHTVETGGCLMPDRFFYVTLGIFLFEQEGILFDRWEGQCISLLQTLAMALKTPRNIAVAQLAMKKKTWAEKVEVAVLLRGRKDEDTAAQ